MSIDIPRSEGGFYRFSIQLKPFRPDTTIESDLNATSRTPIISTSLRSLETGFNESSMNEGERTKPQPLNQNSLGDDYELNEL